MVIFANVFTDHECGRVRGGNITRSFRHTSSIEDDEATLNGGAAALTEATPASADRL
jgi:hypothetical protein